MEKKGKVFGSVMALDTFSYIVKLSIPFTQEVEISTLHDYCYKVENLNHFEKTIFEGFCHLSGFSSFEIEDPTAKTATIRFTLERTNEKRYEKICQIVKKSIEDVNSSDFYFVPTNVNDLKKMLSEETLKGCPISLLNFLSGIEANKIITEALNQKKINLDETTIA